MNAKLKSFIEGLPEELREASRCANIGHWWRLGEELEMLLSEEDKEEDGEELLVLGWTPNQWGATYPDCPGNFNREC